jgi:hypothetical protein
MKRILMLLLVIILLAGCTRHYLRTEGDTVKLYLRAPDAREVFFASSLDGYALHPAQKDGRSTWMACVPAHDEFSYFYIVDGRVVTPQCAYRQQDDFGSDSCVYVPGM